MKKRLKLIITIIVIALIIYIPIWRFLPRSLSDLMSVDENSIKIVSISAQVFNINAPGTSHYEQYHLEEMEQQRNMSKEIVDILSTSSYRQDFRNFWSWGLKSISADRNYDGRTVLLAFNIENPKGEVGFIHFLSSSLILVYGEGTVGYHIYHPTNNATISMLIDYIQTHGVKQ